jgi:ankyrin repeat protein
MSVHTARSKTPDNVAVIPPISPLYLEAIKSNQLPWQHFCDLAELQGMHAQYGSSDPTSGKTNDDAAPLDITIQLPGDMRRKMIPYLVPKPMPVNDVPNNTARIVEYLRNIMPLDHDEHDKYDEEVFSQLNLIFAETSQRSTCEFLKLTVYLLSNKLLLSDPYNRFPSGVRTISHEILKWFQMGNNKVFLLAILSIKTPSIDAFAETIFCSAIEDGDASMIRIFLESGIDPNNLVEDGSSTLGNCLTPLQLAAVTGNVEMAKILLEYGANTSARDERFCLCFSRDYVAFPQTPLQIAARNGNLELMKLLISAGAVVNTPESFWSSALQNAAQGKHYEIVQLLLDAQADINTCFGRYGCALECAIRERSTRLTELLLNSGADVNSSGEDGITPLLSAVKVNDDDMVSCLLKRGAKANTPAATYSWIDGKRNCIQWAIKNGNINILSLLLDHGGDINGEPSLTVAVQESNYEMVEYLLSAGANVDDCRGENTALEAAAEKKDSKMTSILLEAGADPSNDNSISFAAKASDFDLISVLLGRGADINKFGDKMESALYQAAQAENLELVQFLLRNGADPNIGLKHWNRRPILQLLTYRTNMEIINALTQAGADCNNAFSSYYPLNPLQVAASKGDLKLVEYFIAANADVNWPASENTGRTALQAAVKKGHLRIIDFLLANGADINAPAATWNGVTTLQAAISQNNHDLVDFLLDKGANADDQPSKGYGLSALQLAAKRGDNDLILKLLQAGAGVNGPAGDRGGRFAIQAAAENGNSKTVELLLHRGANINAPACFTDGYTALQAAVKGGHFETVLLLLNSGADVNVPDSSAKDGAALVLAAREGYVRIAKLLLAKGANPIEQGAMPALCKAASHGRLDMVKLLISEALKSPDFNRNHLKEALDNANHAGHTSIAKFLECHKVIMGSSCRFGSIQECIPHAMAVSTMTKFGKVCFYSGPLCTLRASRLIIS